ncbi:glucagon receptor isoform X1 [Phyllostomus hastatus]|uniref:glucagon receptor isoform X1 n=1 Tax=Phyllostomus hastatus TaxID=9423 RepID=UPI001E685959|nr:glucagon receptor isoform X1 [Phyllostomus hastatus]XP_045692092.1 glucagon receptor isoform X1 [Phyllostomus hastatus]XP_045692093.1 glucagon receptor isoform X1 [Phyllostomus hastatus]XP_045692094.1 glucagon receptor isoform X1 [Phyllostomus hastatus]XP_045692096.1 glucagon receptor isoform X1 [Phyllostomus hastatus]
MTPTRPRRGPPLLLLLLLLLLACQPQAPSAQVMDFLLEKWKLYGDQCLHNLSLLPPPTELVCNRTFDKYSCWPDTPPNTTASIPCPWYLPWHHKVQHGFVYKTCGPDGQWVRGPRGQPWRNASQCQMDEEEVKVQREEAKLYGAFQAMYTVGYCLSLGALLLALAILLGLRRLHCTRNYIHANLFLSFVLRASSVLAVDALLRTRYSQNIGDDLSVSSWLSGGALAGCRVAAVFMQYGVVANYCWLLVEGVYLHGLLGLAAGPERNFFALYLGVGWGEWAAAAGGRPVTAPEPQLPPPAGAPMLFVVPWAVIKSVFENVQCWTSNDNMAFWWILRLPVFLAILINFFIFIRILHILVAKLRARQMRHTDCKFRLAKSTLTLIPLLGVHEVVFAFVTDEQAQGALRFAKLFFDLFLSSFQGLLVAVLYCFLNKEVQAELLRSWRRWRVGKALRGETQGGSHPASARPTSGAATEKLLLSRGRAGSGTSQGPSAGPLAAGSPPGLADSPF